MQIVKVKNGVIWQVVPQYLGTKFINSSNRFYSNPDIVSMFTVVALYFYVGLGLIAILCRELFEDVLLGDLNISSKILGMTLPSHQQKIIIFFIFIGNPLPFYPIIFTKSPAGFREESDYYKRNMCFLIYFFLIIDSLEEYWLERYYMDEDILWDITLMVSIEELWEAFEVDQ